MFKVGDKLEADEYSKEHHGVKFVIITEVNHEKKIYHWKAKPDTMGTLHSGYKFQEAKKYKE